MRSFAALNSTDFVELVGSFPWTRSITEVHLHHTWLPAYEHYDGLRTIQGMWRHHTQVNGWSDIGQHVSIGPEGTIWLGRNFNWSPASARGFNGNSSAGPFMIEMIGDFDIGKDEMTDEQREATLVVMKSVQRQFGLEPGNLRFHNEMAPKTCPGEQIDKDEWIAATEACELPAPICDVEESAFPRGARKAPALIVDMNPAAPQTDDMSDAEHPHSPDIVDAANIGASPELASRGHASVRGLSASALHRLSDHVINLSAGRLSDSGIVSTSEGDVQRIVNERIVSHIEAAKARGETARILLYAHGGLTSERSALNGALDQLPFWQANNIYPVFFIWETGFAETLKFILLGARELQEAPRGRVREWLDEKVEDLVRSLKVDEIWSAMKRNAEISSSRYGGATYTAGLLNKVLSAAGEDAELHIAGHSAGSIFVTHMLSRLDKVRIKSAHFLAPAISNELFHKDFAPAIGKGVEALAVYNMRKQLELADSVTPLYAKSLLYLVANALEPDRPTPILGLEESIRDDREAVKLFGLSGQPARSAEIIWSQSHETGTGNASLSRTHGDFDNDKATLESMCRRISDKRNGEPIAPYGARESRGNGTFDGPLELPSDLTRYLTSATAAARPAGAEKTCGAGSSSPSPTQQPQPSGGQQTGQKRALCIGINDYPHISKLNGCVADAQTWSNALASLGFDVGVVPQHEATSAGILQRLEDFIGSARPGDQLAFQFAGHGTLIDDTTGDELSGKDSCLCAWDCNNPNGEGGLVVDDDLFRIMNSIIPEAQLTGFIDCCHSGTMARALFAPSQSQIGGGAKPRSVAPQPAMIEAYNKLRSKSLHSRSASGEALKAVFFNACQDSELAWEFDGAGHFTSVAAPFLANSQGLSNAAFAERVIAAFGNAPRQTPRLQADPGKRQAPLAIY